MDVDEEEGKAADEDTNDEEWSAQEERPQSLIFSEGMRKTEAAEKAVLGFVWFEVLFQRADFHIHWLCAMPSGFCRFCCMVVFY